MPYGPIAYYQIRWRPDDSDGEWIQLNFAPDTSKFTIGPLEKGRDYVIQARSVGPTQLVSAWVDVSHTVAGNNPLETPSSLTATPQADGVRLTWAIAATLGAGAQFCIERGTSSTGPWTEKLRTTATYAIMTETVDGTFYYRVRMTNYDGDYSSYSAVVSASPMTMAEIQAQINDIASDNILSPPEKSIIIQDYNWFIPEQSDLDGQATLYGITTEKTTYDTAMSALTSYLATLTTPVLWSNTSGNTNIVGTTFRAKWGDMLTARTKLINKVTSVAKSLISTAQTAATSAQTDATSALNQLSNYSNDNKLSTAEKPTVIRDYTDITAEQSGLDAKATAFGITTEKTAYDAAVSALSTYLATLTTPVMWNNKTDYTTMVGATFNTKFTDVYATRQALLNKIYQVNKDIADSKIKTYYQETAPGSPHIDGDLWTKPSTMVTARWDAGTASWVTSTAYVTGGYGGNLIPNANFQSNRLGKGNDVVVPVGSVLVDGWEVHIDGLTPLGAGGVKWNNKCIVCTINDPTVPASTTLFAQAVLSEPISIDESAWYTLSANISQVYNGTLGSNISVESRLTAQWLSDTGAVLGQSSVIVGRGAGSVMPLTDVDPPAGTTQALIYINTRVTNSGGTARSATSGTVALQTTFKSISMVKKADVEVPGSGKKIGDTRNLPGIVVGNGIAKVPTVITYTSAAGAPATATISVAAFTILSGSVSISYGAKSVGVSHAAGTVNYFLYLDDPNYNGTGTLVATTNGDNVFSADGRIYIGGVTVVFPSSGTGGGSGYGGGGGRGDTCVCIDMMLSEHFMASEAKVGYVIDCLDLPTSDVPFKRAIEKVSYHSEDCVRLTTDGGAELELSVSTPFDLIDGRQTFAIKMLNEVVVTDRGLETVVKLERLGIQPVVKISVGGVSYAAGRDPTHRIYSHNPLKP